MADYMKLSQDATNELWSVVLRRDYETPGAKKRAVERVIRGAIESALGVPSTVDGHEEGIDPLWGQPSPTPKPNPYARPSHE